MTKERIKNELIAVTNAVKRLIYDIPKIELSVLLNMSRPTLDKRIETHAWSHEEKLIIDELKKQHA